jgi:hypothetical protein
MAEEKSLTVIQQEAMAELANPEVYNALLRTTFKGLKEETMKLAIMDGIIRGFTFKDFRERNVYAIPYGETYSLVTSIDNARKIGAKSGVVGEDEPRYDEEPNMGLVCSVTVHKRVDGYVGDFTAKVYFKEFSTGRNLWLSKPRVMIAKVAEMHALRKACPEELAQAYTEEEIEQAPALKVEKKAMTIEEGKAKLGAAKDMAELGTIWSALPMEVKADKDVQILKEDLKLSFDPNH